MHDAETMCRQRLRQARATLNDTDVRTTAAVNQQPAHSEDENITEAEARSIMASAVDTASRSFAAANEGQGAAKKRRRQRAAAAAPLVQESPPLQDPLADLQDSQPGGGFTSFNNVIRRFARFAVGPDGIPCVD